MPDKTNAPYVPHISNQVPSIMGVEGTLGTADTSGSARVLPIGVNPATGAMYVQDLSGASGTTNIVGTVAVSNVEKGTINTLGTVGSVASVGQVHNAGTIQALPQVSVGTIPNVNVATGTQQTLGTVGVINNGTLALVTTVTTVSNLTNGTVNVNTGTINVGTFVNPSGTITTIVAGTQNTLGTVGVVNSVAEVVKGTTTLVSTVTTVSNLTNGSVIVQSGTLGSVGAVAQVHNAGTIQAGTVQISKTPVQLGTPFVVRGTTDAAVWGTIIAAAGAGTKQYVSRLSVVVESGTVDVAVTYIGVDGSAGAGVIARGKFVPSAGISHDFDPVIPSNTNGTLAYWLGGAGTVAITVNYWQGV